jgi:ABC-type phosphate transport system permease subunit
MAAPWERLFVWVARTLGWVVVLTPLGMVGVVCAAAATGRQRSDPASFLGLLGAQVATTLAIAIIAAALGASTGIGTAIVARELGAGRAARLIGGFAFGLTLFPATVLGWFTATVILPALPSRSAVAVLVAACVALTLTVVARSNRLADQTLARVPRALREAAAAAGADARRLSAYVLLPSCRFQLVGIYVDAR